MKIGRLVISDKQLELIKYVVVGGVNTVFGYAVYAAGLWLGLSYVLAALASQILGTIFNYFSYGIFVFSRRPEKSSVLRFAVQYGFYYLLTLFILWLLQSVGLNAYQAGLANTAIIPVLTYFTNKYFVFKAKKEESDA
jgi:putative flippase GtrA